MNKLVYIIWMSLTLTVTILTIYCMFQPAWYVHSNHVNSFGPIVYCEGVPMGSHYSRGLKQHCQPYGGKFAISNIPSGAWQASFLLFFTGTFSFCVSVVLGVVVLFVWEKYVQNISSLVLYFQTSAVLLTISALVTFPVGLNSHYFRYYCGESASPFYPDNCNIGWSYMVSVMAASLSIFSPILWCFKGLRWNEYQFKEYV